VWCQVKILSFILDSAIYDFDRHADISDWGFLWLFLLPHRAIFWDNILYYSTAASFHTLPFDPMWSELLAQSSSKATDMHAFRHMTSQCLSMYIAAYLPLRQLRLTGSGWELVSGIWPGTVSNKGYHWATGLRGLSSISSQWSRPIPIKLEPIAVHPINSLWPILYTYHII